MLKIIEQGSTAFYKSGKIFLIAHSLHCFEKDLINDN